MWCRGCISLNYYWKVKFAVVKDLLKAKRLWWWSSWPWGKWGYSPMADVLWGDCFMNFLNLNFWHSASFLKNLPPLLVMSCICALFLSPLSRGVLWLGVCFLYPLASDCCRPELTEQVQSSSRAIDVWQKGSLISVRELRFQCCWTEAIYIL